MMSKLNLTGSSTIKKMVYASILMLSLLVLTPRLTAAQSADGRFEFSIEERLTKYMEFSAITNGDGSATGEMTFSGPAEFPDQDVDGTGRAGFSGSLENHQIDVRFDGMVVEQNRAVMSGTVTGSNLEDYIGQRVLLVVEDNGEAIEERVQDTLTWGLYKPLAQDWIPTDAELEEDEGARLTWWATDAEREDDRGVPSNPSKEITCQSFPLSAYSFIEAEHSAGEIQVRP